MSQLIQMRRGTAAQWIAANPILASGELGIETISGKFKIGDGVTRWILLGYATDVDLPHYFKLDQTVTQTVSGGQPIFGGMYITGFDAPLDIDANIYIGYWTSGNVITHYCDGTTAYILRSALADYSQFGWGMDTSLGYVFLQVNKSGTGAQLPLAFWIGSGVGAIRAWDISVDGHFLSNGDGTGIRNITTAGNITVLSDSTKIFVGAGSDMAVGYNGTAGVIDTSVVAPSDLKLTCGTEKTLELQNVVWDDLRINAGAFDRPGVSDPVPVVYYPAGGGLGVSLYEFKKNDWVSFTCQLPHGYKQGTDIKVHLHWTPGDRGNEENGNTVGWKIDYAWANVDGTFSAMQTADLSDACDGTDHKHQMTPEVTIDGHTAAKHISSMLVCNLRRSDTGTDDTWASAASGQLPMILEVDFHYQIDTIGSRQTGVK
jgi:hypothetical protein